VIEVLRIALGRFAGAKMLVLGRFDGDFHLALIQTLYGNSFYTPSDYIDRLDGALSKAANSWPQNGDLIGSKNRIFSGLIQLRCHGSGRMICISLVGICSFIENSSIN
jgi:hypothetical protein